MSKRIASLVVVVFISTMAIVAPAISSREERFSGYLTCPHDADHGPTDRCAGRPMAVFIDKARSNTNVKVCWHLSLSNGAAEDSCADLRSGRKGIKTQRIVSIGDVGPLVVTWRVGGKVVARSKMQVSQGFCDPIV